MDNWMREALSGFIDENLAAFEAYLRDSALTSEATDPASEIMDELRPRE